MPKFVYGFVESPCGINPIAVAIVPKKYWEELEGLPGEYEDSEEDYLYNIDELNRWTGDGYVWVFEGITSLEVARDILNSLSIEYNKEFEEFSKRELC